MSENETGVRAASELFARGQEQIGRVIAGQHEAIAQALLTMLCGGHALIEGVPGFCSLIFAACRRRLT